MRTYIKYIGLIDKFRNCHHIDLTEGLNIITGRSSTGKSAVIEIFDYCTGNTDNTIPEGIITDNAILYFVVFCNEETNLVLGRYQEDKSTTAFLKVETMLPSMQELNLEYFSKDYFLPLRTFKERLGHFWGLDISAMDEAAETIYSKVKKGRPSFRNMVPFMLQHQNLIANKHSLFYRFDEKEKRERTIEEFKIFAGIVDQDYFILKQKLDDKQTEYEKAVRSSNQFESEKEVRIKHLDSLLNQYRIISGCSLFSGISATHLLNSPKLYKDQLSVQCIEVDEASDEYKKSFLELEAKKNQHLAQRRKLLLKLAEINTSISNVERYARTIDKLKPVTEVIYDKSFCPFCKQESTYIELEVNKLSEAINWLNTELRKAPLMSRSFLPEKRKVENEIESINFKIRDFDKEQKKILEINEALDRNKSLEEQSLKVLLSIENELDWALDKKNDLLELDVDGIKREINSMESELREKYNVENKLNDAEDFINTSMIEIGEHLDFEESYKPFKLHFDIKNFELYSLKKTDNTEKKIYLRSMGSGANWLYSHICLFLGILKYFSSLGDRSTVPTVLFLDQPSQVYFPSMIDINEEAFDASELKKLEGRGEKVDMDLMAVTNLFQQIVNFIDNVNEEYGFKPQIVISDHADNLKLNDDVFEECVRRRWRKKNEGFINKDLLK